MRVFQHGYNSKEFDKFSVLSLSPTVDMERRQSWDAARSLVQLFAKYRRLSSKTSDLVQLPSHQLREKWLFGPLNTLAVLVHRGLRSASNTFGAFVQFGNNNGRLLGTLNAAWTRPFMQSTAHCGWTITRSTWCASSTRWMAAHRVRPRPHKAMGRNGKDQRERSGSRLPP